MVSARPARHGRRRADIGAQLAALQDLDARGLRAEWRRLYHAEPPNRVSHELLRLTIAWKLQEKVYGGLSAGTKRKLAALAESPSDGSDTTRKQSVRLKPGATLIREWRGETHTVSVLEDGFRWNGEHYRSLSMIARQITGARWSGPRFFGLERKADPADVTHLTARGDG